MRWLKFGEDTLTIKNSINILGAEIDSRRSFNRHLQGVACIAFLRVILLSRIDGLLRLFKTQLRPIMEYSPLSLMSIALERVQRKAIQFFRDASGLQQQRPYWYQW